MYIYIKNIKKLQFFKVLEKYKIKFRIKHISSIRN